VDELQRLEAQIFGLIVAKKVEDGAYAYDPAEVHEPCS
jgi:hypothetical protein